VWSIRSLSFLCLVGSSAARALRRRVQIALKPASKGLGLHRIFKRGKGRKYVIADSTFKRMQVDAWACWLDAGEHHLGFALRTEGAPKCNRWNGGRQALRLGHGTSPSNRRERNTLSHRYAWEGEPVMLQVYAAGISNAS
jgi:hypothetical protein